MKTPGEKSLLTFPKHPKIINWSKKGFEFSFSYFFVVLQKGFMKARRLQNKCCSKFGENIKFNQIFMKYKCKKS